MKVLKLLILFLCLSCSQEKNQIVIEITNSLDIERKYETVELSKGFLELENLEGLGVKDLETNKLLTSQLVDNDGDGVNDVLLFQPNVPAGATNNYQVTKVAVDTAEVVCYSRFVPERTDDYAWENNKVAFRTYGPNAQYRFENKLKEGTLSSGIDAWLKRVEYSIIDKWYKKYTEKTGTYHKDTGEGLDNFHVGSSRGVGGIAYKKDSTFYISKNFLDLY